MKNGYSWSVQFNPTVNVLHVFSANLGDTALAPGTPRELESASQFYLAGLLSPGKKCDQPESVVFSW